MANPKHTKIIAQGGDAWNAWRLKHPDIKPDLSEEHLMGADLRNADLSESDLSYAYLHMVNLRRANLNKSNLSAADLSEAFLRVAKLKAVNLRGASLEEANLSITDLSEADLRGATLRGADLRGAYLRGAMLSGADLIHADLTGANVTGADLSEVKIGWTVFGDNDLSTVRGLETIHHTGPSTIGIDTLFKSEGNIPDAFLRAAGVPEDFIIFTPSLIGRAIEFYSCFISYSHRDEEFSRRLHSRMRSENLRVWYAPEDLKGGKKLHEEIFRAIQVHDKLLLVLSEESMKSEWVATEIRRARRVEGEENRRKLFPIRLVNFDAIQKWECFDADSGKDLAVELREYYIPDFSNWKSYDAFEAEFAKLLRDLKATERLLTGV